MVMMKEGTKCMTTESNGVAVDGLALQVTAERFRLPLFCRRERLATTTFRGLLALSFPQMLFVLFYLNTILCS